MGISMFFYLFINICLKILSKYVEFLNIETVSYLSNFQINTYLILFENRFVYF